MMQDWSVDASWMVTQQSLAGWTQFSATHPTRLIFPRWIQWHKQTYHFNEARSLARVGCDDPDEQTGEKITFQIRGAWGVVIFYTCNNAHPRTLALKVTHRQRRQVIENRLQSALRHALRDPTLVTYADLFLIPLAIQYGDGLVADGPGTPQFSLRPSFLLDQRTRLPQRRPLAFILCEAMDMDLFASCCVPLRQMQVSLGGNLETERLMASRMDRLRPWKKHIVRQFIKSVRFLHKRNWVHCDIKLENILIAAHGEHQSEAIPPRIKLCDFDTISRPGRTYPFEDCKGTLDCYSPERHRDYMTLMSLQRQLTRVRREYKLAQQRYASTASTQEHTLGQQQQYHQQQQQQAVTFIQTLQQDVERLKVQVSALKHQERAVYKQPSLAWQFSDDIWSAALVLLAILTERTWGHEDMKHGKFLREYIHSHLQSSGPKWMEAFPNETVDSVTNTIMDMCHIDPSKRILVPTWERQGYIAPILRNNVININTAKVVTTKTTEHITGHPLSTTMTTPTLPKSIPFKHTKHDSSSNNVPNLSTKPCLSTEEEDDPDVSVSSRIAVIQTLEEGDQPEQLDTLSIYPTAQMPDPIEEPRYWLPSDD